MKRTNAEHKPSFKAKSIITHTLSLVKQWPHNSMICIYDTTAHSIKLVFQHDKQNQLCTSDLTT